MLQRIKKDLTLGQNIEVYVTILISSVVFILAVFNVVDIHIVNAVILAVLSLLTVHILQERWSRQQLVTKMFPQRTWNDVENVMRERLRSAVQVRFITISPLGIVRKYNQELKQILEERTGEIEFIVVDPSSKAMELIKKGRPENYDDGLLFLAEIRKSFDKHLQSGNLKIKLIDYIPNHIVTFLREPRAGWIIFATVYSFAQVDPYRPSKIITSNEEVQYIFFNNEFETLWNMNSSRTYK